MKPVTVVSKLPRPVEKPEPGPRPPAGRRVAQLLALAHQMEGMLARGEVRTQTQLAKLAGVTPARVTQILSLLDLAPTIQEAVIEQTGPTATERALFAIAAEACWKWQIEAWQRQNLQTPPV